MESEHLTFFVYQLTKCFDKFSLLELKEACFVQLNQTKREENLIKV